MDFTGWEHIADEKLRNLILYICKLSEDDPSFDMQKLETLLFFCDFTAYRRSGHSITGQTYIEQGEPTMASIEEEISAIEAQLAKLTELRDRYGALDGDVVTFIKALDEGGGPYQMTALLSPRIVAEILKNWEEFKAAKV